MSLTLLGRVVLLSVLSGCFPAVTHGPRVENGPVFGVTAAMSTGDAHVEGDEGGIRLRQAVTGPFAGYGWAPSSSRVPGFHIALAVPVFFPLAQLDAYLQAPPAWTGPFSSGVGITANIEGVTPYVQLGVQPQRGIGWHVSGGYGVRESSSTFQSTSAAWFGSAALSFSEGYVRSHLFVQAGWGRIPGSCIEQQPGTRTCSQGERATSFATGLSLGRHGRNVGRP